jgi:hypothetical protein
VAAEYRQVVQQGTLAWSRAHKVWSVVLNAVASNPQANPQVHPLPSEELTA